MHLIHKHMIVWILPNKCPYLISLIILFIVATGRKHQRLDYVAGFDSLPALSFALQLITLAFAPLDIEITQHIYWRHLRQYTLWLPLLLHDPSMLTISTRSQFHSLISSAYMPRQLSPRHRCAGLFNLDQRLLRLEELSGSNGAIKRRMVTLVQVDF